MNKIIPLIRRELRKNIDKEYKAGCENFFKEKIIYYGVRTPIVRRIARDYFKEIKDINKKELFEICESLYKSRYNEESTIATQWIIKSLDKITDKDFPALTIWIDKYLDNWGKIDDYCTHVISSMLIKYPSLMKNLKDWSISKNLWVRRASAVGLITTDKDFYKKEKNLNFIFQIAKKLMHDQENLVQKGYGWMLKVTADTKRQEVFEFVMKHKKTMPRTALRYAIEKMPKNLKIKVMKK